MDNLNQLDSVRFQTVEINNQSITLLNHQSKILSVDKKDVRKITLMYGFQSERPLVEIGFGVTIIVLGLYFIIKFLLEILVNRILYVDGVLSLLLLPVGGWFIIDGFRKRLYFEVVMDNDKRKFPLDKNPNKSELQKFIEVASKLGYFIDAKLLDDIKQQEKT